MNYGIATHKSIRSTHTILARLEKEVNSILPEEDSELVIKMKYAHQYIDRIITETQAINIQKELNRTWDSIHRYKLALDLTNNEKTIDDAAKRNSIKHELYNYIVDRIHLKIKKRGTLKEIVDKLIKEENI